MSNKIKLGDFNSLRVVKRVDFGIYLDGGEEGEILLPTRYVPEEVSIGDELEVFIYLDQDERLIATTEATCQSGRLRLPRSEMGERIWRFLGMGTDERPFLSLP